MQPNGYTPQGQGLTNLQDVLNQITGMAQQAPSDPSAAVSNAVTSAQNVQQPQAIQSATQQLTQQSGIPALQGQQQNLGQIFQMYLADQNLAGKYANPSLSSPNSPIYGNQSLNTQGSAIANLGTPNNFNDPYLSGGSQLVNAIMGNQMNGQGFQGFTTPSQNTSAIGVVPSSATSIINTLQGAINNQQGLVNTGVSNYQNQYSNLMSTLNNLLTNQASNAFSQAQPGTAQSLQKSLNSVKADVDSGMTFTSLLQKYETDPNMTAAKIQEMYDAKHAVSGDKWGPAQITPQLAAAYNLKQTPASAQTKYQLKTIGTTQYNYDPKTGKIYDMNGKQLNSDAFSGQNQLQDVFGKLQQAWNTAKAMPTPANRQKYMTEKQLMADKLYYALTKSRAYQGAQQLVNKLPDPWNPIDTLGGQGDAAFSGFQDQLNLGGQQAIEGTPSSTGKSSKNSDPLGIL